MRDHIAEVYSPRMVDSLDRMLDESAWVTFEIEGRRGEPVIVVRAAPGNGTLYQFILVECNVTMGEWMGLPQPGWLLALEPGGIHKGTMSVRNPRESHPSYIMEKLGMNLSDAVAMSLILDRVGREIT